MAIALEQTLTGTDSGSGITLTSWTPLANELVLVCVFERNELLATTISGNGLTWVQVIDVNDNQGQCGLTVWRGMSASPSAGSITIGNTSGFAFAIAIRLSGTDTTGTNGSGAVEATAGATTGATDNNDITVAVTTVTNNAWAIGFVVTHGGGTLTLVDETTISINNTSGSAGNTITSHEFYQAVAVAGSTTLLGSNSFSTDREWVIAGISIKPQTGTAYNQTVSGTIAPTGAVTKSTHRNLAGGLTPAGTVHKLISRILAGGITPTGLVNKLTTRLLAGTVGSSGALVSAKVLFKSLGGTVAPSGALIKRTGKVLGGAVTPQGGLLKRLGKILAGSVTPTGTLTSLKVIYVYLEGTVAPTGALVKRTAKALAGSVASAGSLLKRISKFLSGSVTPTGSLSRSSSQTPIPQLPRGTIFSQNRLSYLITPPAWGGGTGFFQDVTMQVKDYDQSSTALGGFWNATLSLRLPLEEMEDWLANGVGRQLTVKGRANTVVWEGIVDRVSLEVGGYSMTVGPYMDIANKVKLSYSVFLQLGGGNATGIRVVTPYTTNTASAARYGVLEKNFSVGGIDESEVTNLQAMLLERFSFPARSEDLSLPGGDRNRFVDVKLECVGYGQLFQKYIYNSATTGLQDLSAKLAAIIAAEPNGIFTSQIETNTIQVPAYENDDKEAWGLIKGLVTMGNSSQDRAIFGVYANQRAVYRIPGNDVVYIRPLREGTSVIQDTAGGLLQPWQILPGNYIWVSDLVPGKPLDRRLDRDPRVLFAETVQYRLPDQLVINGAHSYRVEQKLAQLGISGIG